MAIATRPATVMTAADLHRLLTVKEGPCVSIYFPSNRHPAHFHENRIAFRNHLQTVERSFGAHVGREVEEMRAHLRELEGDEELWKNARNGFAAFASPHLFEVYLLDQAVPDLGVVAQSFHVKPLIRFVQESHQFYLLCVSEKRVALYRGNRQAMEEIELHPDVPRDMGEALGEPAHVVDKLKDNVADYSDGDQRDRQLLRYFQRLSRSIEHHHRLDRGVPMVLAALSEYHGLFREAWRLPNLVADGIRRDPFKAINDNELREMAWEVFVPHWQAHLQALRERYEEARSKGKAHEQLDAVARAAAFGKVGVLLIQENYHVGGVVDRGTGAIQQRDLNDPAVDDVIDDIAEIVLSQKDNEVLVLRQEEMPGKGPLAAIERY